MSVPVIATAHLNIRFANHNLEEELQQLKKLQGSRRALPVKTFKLHFKLQTKYLIVQMRLRRQYLKTTHERSKAVSILRTSLLRKNNVQLEALYGSKEISKSQMHRTQISKIDGIQHGKLYWCAIEWILAPQIGNSP